MNEEDDEEVERITPIQMSRIPPIDGIVKTICKEGGDLATAITEKIEVIEE